MMENSQTGSRVTSDEYFLQMAELVAKRATCIRRRVGCVLVNIYKHVLATGYNGVAAGRPHCIDYPCSGAGLPSGYGLHLCEAVHAEWNALIQCNDSMAIHTAYCTASPCMVCVRMLMNTSCDRIVFRDVYPHPEARQQWIDGGREWMQLNR
jgi:dCMP deaminase